MPNWKHTLDIVDLWKQADEETITPQLFCQELMNKLHPFDGPLEGTDDIVAELNDVVLTDTATFDDVDEVLESLYDWADMHRVWVKKV